MARRAKDLRLSEARGCVGRALELAHAALTREPGEAISLPALAAAAGVSPRTLQRHFARNVKLSPRMAVERLRLAGARQTLCANQAPSVLAAGSRHGFEHPGRFAIAYTRAFGERPSVTLRAARTRPESTQPAPGTPVVLHPLAIAFPQDAACARRATDDLAIALGGAHEVVLLSAEAAATQCWDSALRLSGRIEGGCAILSLVQNTSGVVLLVLREPLAGRGGRGWAARATEMVCTTIATENLALERRTPWRSAMSKLQITRARPAAL
ncbi:helix-turn-helix domain-containing protein [Roseomonas sp. CAU 1739]|uniref:helix-turn-helix domain-containing protein n=1 Tax=Roseomonas sp. CAU 1739 TaxID=3140364 RepID=UPI00325AB2DE